MANGTPSTPAVESTPTGAAGAPSDMTELDAQIESGVDALAQDLLEQTRDAAAADGAGLNFESPPEVDAGEVRAMLGEPSDAGPIADSEAVEAGPVEAPSVQAASAESATAVADAALETVEKVRAAVNELVEPPPPRATTDAIAEPASPAVDTAGVATPADNTDAEAVDELLSEVGADLIEAGAQIDSAIDQAAAELQEPASATTASDSSTEHTDAEQVSTTGEQTEAPVTSVASAATPEVAPSADGTPPIERLDTRLAEKADQMVAEAEEADAAQASAAQATAAEASTEKANDEHNPADVEVADSPVIAESAATAVAAASPQPVAAAPAAPELEDASFSAPENVARTPKPAMAAAKSAGPSKAVASDDEPETAAEQGSLKTRLATTVAPAAVKVASVAARPIERVTGKLSAKTRQTIGFIAAVTIFHALVAWAFLLMRDDRSVLPESKDHVTLVKPGDPVQPHTPYQTHVKPVAKKADDHGSHAKDDHGGGHGGAKDDGHGKKDDGHGGSGDDAKKKPSSKSKSSSKSKDKKSKSAKKDDGHDGGDGHGGGGGH